MAIVEDDMFQDVDFFTPWTVQEALDLGLEDQ